MLSRSILFVLGHKYSYESFFYGIAVCTTSTNEYDAKIQNLHYVIYLSTIFCMEQHKIMTLPANREPKYKIVTSDKLLTYPPKKAKMNCEYKNQF